MARISTHVLNTALGKPAAGIPIEIYHGPALLATTRTNADGRTDKPLVERETLDHGAYTLVFHVHEYAFFETIRIQFIVSQGNENYRRSAAAFALRVQHVPGLMSALAEKAIAACRDLGAHDRRTGPHHAPVPLDADARRPQLPERVDAEPGDARGHRCGGEYPRTAGATRRSPG